MLRRLPLGFAGVLITAIAIAACSSSSATQTISVGPNFPPQTLYVTNVTQNAVSIYSPVPKSTGGPIYQIGGSYTTLSGPQYLTFDSSTNLWVTNWLASTKAGEILEFKTAATGNVLPYQTLALGSVRPRGIADFPYTFTGVTTSADVLAVTVTNPGQPTDFVSGIQFYTAALLTTPWMILAGPSTGLNVPSGIAVDKNNNLYVANLQGQSVTVYAMPSATPTASPTPTPTASPTPSPTPTGATASPSPTPVPTPTPYNVAPIATISGTGSGINQPTGIALDSAGNIYVSDQASTVCTPDCPAILVFSPGANGAQAPMYHIAGAKTLLVAPTDVKVDGSGNIYVADQAAGGAGIVYVFAPVTSASGSGNVAPIATLNSPGAVIGLGLIP
ncbi:MAG TPA: hypothetical protein VMD47_04230 [Candidatus Acidoferrales bacterium]|nr:hypothetical protein [Candidatus Acidoferrales bacterium]